MINVEDEKKEVKKKSLLEKIAPLVLIALLIFVGFFLFNTFNPGEKDIIVDSGDDQLLERAKMDELIEFINSPEFNNLVHVPDPDIFN
ncbi:MAG: hypothetical protein PWQ56_451 [Patescibacteria group bacterium]|nr:hypothetical protein [Patescibacteria group bacterium]